MVANIILDLAYKNVKKIQKKLDVFKFHVML